MKTYYVIVNVAGTEYLTKTMAGSPLSAETHFIGKGICGKKEYGVSAAMAFDSETMKTDTFVGCALGAVPCEATELLKIIEANNRRIKIEEATKEVDSEISELEKRLESLRVRRSELMKEAEEA